LTYTVGPLFLRTIQRGRCFKNQVNTKKGDEGSSLPFSPSLCGGCVSSVGVIASVLSTVGEADRGQVQGVCQAPTYE